MIVWEGGVEDGADEGGVVVCVGLDEGTDLPDWPAEDEVFVSGDDLVVAVGVAVDDRLDDVAPEVEAAGEDAEAVVASLSVPAWNDW